MSGFLSEEFVTTDMRAARAVGDVETILVSGLTYDDTRRQDTQAIDESVSRPQPERE